MSDYPSRLPNIPIKKVGGRKSGVSMGDLVNSLKGFKSTNQDKDKVKDDERIYSNAG